MKETLVKFITDNELNFNSSGSGLNGAYTVLCGYADHLGASKKAVKEAVVSSAGLGTYFPSDHQTELNKVYSFASTYNYGKYWASDEAKRMYKF